ncbi:MAG: GNAT family N-acetyltransferase [Macrococcus canis]|uniref:GNAT family N-acetyltransferase n=1 Tax=Macrococcoides canis TaxID=1855823 RepID=UPI002E7858C5|nr:GNAT family N-acetyltransferase [Macrococcus canis]MEE1106904.1 GNAT family N-acetyltransferase [Macrococcus canis]
MLSFRDTHNSADILEENARYIHYHTPSQLIKYYANYFEYKEMPTLELFKEDLSYQREFHMKHRQQHLLFIFPDNEVIPESIVTYAKDYACNLEMMELYELKHPKQLRYNDDVVSEVVTQDGPIFDDFLKVCAAGESEYGEDFVNLKEETHRRDLLNSKILQIVAYIDNTPAGKIEAIMEEDTVEIDDFYVIEAYRRRGIGSRLQEAVYNHAHGKQVFLIADGNDTARDMYMRQGYHKIAERYELLLAPHSND